MSIAIAIMAALFVGVVVDAVYDVPKYEDYCNEYMNMPKVLGRPVEAENCDDPYFVSQDEIRACENGRGTPEFEYDENGCNVYTECNYCSKEYNDANEKYNRNLFFIISPLAVIMILIGLLYGFEIVASGLMMGGILLLIYSTGRYFSDMSKIMRVVVVFIELVLLIWIAIKKMQK